MNNPVIKDISNKNDINTEERTFGAFASVSIVDRQNDYIDMKEFRPVLEKIMSSDRKIQIHDAHTNHPCGIILDYTFKTEPNSGKEGLYITAKIYNDYDTDTDIWEKIKDGTYTGISLGGRAGSKTPTCNESQCYNILSDIEIWEFSLVSIPANSGALITGFNKLAKSLKFSKEDAKRIGDKLKIDWNKINIDEFQTGLEIELEHGKKNPKTNITDDNEEMTAKIALVHLLEFPDYYSKTRGLPKMEDTLKRENPILKYVRQCGDQWCVYSEAGKRLGTHPSKEDANNQLRAIEVNKIHKTKVYVKNPQDVPPDVKLQEGKRGGKYYESGQQESLSISHEIKEVDPQEFETIKSKVPQNMKYFLSTYTPEQMKEKGIKTYLTANKTAGVALNGDEIINLFSLQSGEGKKALIAAIEKGGRRLDCFDKRSGENYGLPDYYKKFGFKEVKREKNWTIGEPDIVYMSL